MNRVDNDNWLSWCGKLAIVFAVAATLLSLLLLRQGMAQAAPRLERVTVYQTGKLPAQPGPARMLVRQQGQSLNHSLPLTTPTMLATTTSTTTPTATPTIDPTNTPTATPTATDIPCVINFEDVPPSHPYYDSIRFVACRNIMNGRAGTPPAVAFYPDEPNRRGEVAKQVVRAFNVLPYTPATPTFRDVMTNNVFYRDIEAAAHANLLNGDPCPPGTSDLCFRPLSNISRSEVGAAVVRTLGYIPLTPTVPTFQDVPPSYRYYAEIEGLAQLGIADLVM